MNNGKQNLLKTISQHFVNALKLKISSRIENYVKFIFNATENFHAKRNANQHKTLIKRKLISRHFSRSIWKCEERNFNKLCYLMKSHVFISVDVSLWAENISLRFSLHKRKYKFQLLWINVMQIAHDRFQPRHKVSAYPREIITKTKFAWARTTIHPPVEREHCMISYFVAVNFMSLTEHHVRQSTRSFLGRHEFKLSHIILWFFLRHRSERERVGGATCSEPIGDYQRKLLQCVGTLSSLEAHCA